MATPVIKSLPLSKIFVDARIGKIFAADDNNPQGVRVPHTDGPGYQRDPWSRIKWIQERMPINEALMRPIEVSERDDGTYAAMDGGGRFVIGQISGLTHILCRIHKDLTRQQEAERFTILDSEVYKLRSIENFVADLAAEKPVAVAIAKAARPYTLAPSGDGTLKCIGPLTYMYVNFADDIEAPLEEECEKGLELISKVCKISAVGWSGWRKGGQTSGRPIDTKYFTGLAIFVDGAGDKLDADILIKLLTKHSHKSLEADINNKQVKKQQPVLNGFPLSVAIAKYLVVLYNRALVAKGSDSEKITKQDIDNSTLLETIEEESFTYAKFARDARKRARAAHEAATEDESA